MERAQKEYYLNEKLKAIQKEIGRGEQKRKRRAEKDRSTPRDVSKGSHATAVRNMSDWELMPPMSAESHGQAAIPRWRWRYRGKRNRRKSRSSKPRRKS